MKTDLERARAILEERGVTCALVHGETVYTSAERGVKALMGWLNDGTDLKRFSAADKVVGKATALLYCLLGVDAVHANVISQSAVRVLQSHGIGVSWGVAVDFIWNRTQTGPCPMENAVRDIDDPALAPGAIREALARLQHAPLHQDGTV